MRSGELARLAGVSTDTLRHYERLGILPEPLRTESGYRNYASGSVERVRLIQSALTLGFSLQDLASVLSARDRGRLPCLQVRAMARQKLKEVEKEIRDLLAARNYLQRTLKSWDGRLKRTGKGRPARLLENLPAGINARSRGLSGKFKKGGTK